MRKKWFHPSRWPGRTKSVAIQLVPVLVVAAALGQETFGEWGSVYLGVLLAIVVVAANLMYDVAMLFGEDVVPIRRGSRALRQALYPDVPLAGGRGLGRLAEASDVES